MDDIVSAAKFLQIEGAKDFILPKPQSQQQSSHQTSHTSTTTAKMQIDLQSKSNTKNLITQQSAQQKTMSLLSKMVQKPLNLRAVTKESDSMPIISSVRRIDERDLNKVVKEEVIDEELDDEEEDNDCMIENELKITKKSTNCESVMDKKNEKSGMFAEFEDQGISSNNKNINESKSSSSNDNKDEPMDTSIMGHILAKVPVGTSVSTKNVNESQQKSHDLNGIVLIELFEVIFCKNGITN